MSDKVILVKYQRKRSSPKSNSATVMEDDSSPRTPGEASLKPSYPKAELDQTQNDELKENSVVPKIGKEDVAKLAPFEGFPLVKGKSMQVPPNDKVRDSVGVQCMQPNLAKIDTLIKEQAEDKLPERSPLSEPTSYVIHGTKGKAKYLEQLEDLNKELEGTKEDSNSSSNMEKCGESKLNQMNYNIWRNQLQQEISFFDASRGHTSQISRSKGKLPMENSGVPAYEEQQPKAASNSSFVHTDFLDPYRTYAGSLNSEGLQASLQDFRSRQSQSSFNFRNADHIYERNMHWHGMGGDALFGQPKRISPKWSEEELDSLWIGVRRYGQNSWNAILADSTLCFYKSRVVEDLADQWDREREMLLNGMYSTRTRLSRPRFSPSPFVANPAINNHYSGQTTLPRYSNIQTFRAEASRTSGDSSFHQNEANTNASIPHSSGVIMASPISYRAPPESPSLSSTPLRSSSCQKSDDTPKQKHQSPPNSTTRTRRLSKASNTQQWVLGLPAPNSAQMRRRRRVSPVLNSCNPPAPPATEVVPRRGHGVLKRKNVASDDSGPSAKVSGNAAPIDEAWLRKRLCVSPNVGLTFQKPTSDDSGGNQEDNNLVVTDTGDSSEDTVSDH